MTWQAARTTPLYGSAMRAALTLAARETKAGRRCVDFQTKAAQRERARRWRGPVGGGEATWERVAGRMNGFAMVAGDVLGWEIGAGDMVLSGMIAGG